MFLKWKSLGSGNWYVGASDLVLFFPGNEYGKRLCFHFPPSDLGDPQVNLSYFWLQAVEFLSKALDSPDIKAVDEAVILLQEIGE